VPIYEYRCSNGHQFEVMQRFSDPPVSECDECGAPVQKVLTAPAIHFKGSGFHNTDYGRGKASRNGEGGEGKSGGESSASSSSSGESSGAAASTSSPGSSSGSSGSDKT
jgi:putative FmdB family regulatory protein